MKHKTAAQQKKQLDEFLAYMKENWKIVLSELIAAGVTAYLDYNSKQKPVKAIR